MEAIVNKDLVHLLWGEEITVNKGDKIKVEYFANDLYKIIEPEKWNDITIHKEHISI